MENVSAVSHSLSRCKKAARIVLVPPCRTEANVVDVLVRAAWGIGFSAFRSLTIFVEDLAWAETAWRVPLGMDPAIAAHFSALKPRVRWINPTSAESILSEVREADVVLYREDPPECAYCTPEALAQAVQGKRVFAVDPARTRQEFGNWVEVNFLLRGSGRDDLGECERRFGQLVDRLGHFEVAYCLATGPSLAQFRDTRFENGLRILCNSAFLDEELMQWVQPQLLVFADPIFHFGPSLYAATFRQRLRESCARHDYTILVPLKYYGLLTDAFPDLRSRVIGIPSDKPNGFSLDLRREFRVFTTANILTYLMLPLAATFARKVHFLGCDGRPLEQNQYFWQHNRKTQINDQMANIQEVHPGFFAIDYNDYYFEHCEVLERMLSEGERLGHAFGTVTPSYIPALRDRPVHVPRLLIFDLTEVGSTTATGQLKELMLAGWPKDRWLQVRPLSTKRGDRFRIRSAVRHALFDDHTFTWDEVLRECEAFRPEVAYLRPTEAPPEFIELSLHVVKRLGIPWVAHIMDDWPERLKEANPDLFERVEPVLREILQGARNCLGISQAMRDAYQDRYGIDFEPLANGIRPEEWPVWDQYRCSREPLVIRYCGGLASDMNRASVLRFARVVSTLHHEYPIAFEVCLLPIYVKEAEELFRGLKGVSIKESVDAAEYRQRLSSAGALLIAYNFDDTSIRYTRYSLANKLPECLATGVPVIVFGPDEIATVQAARAWGASVVVSKEDEETLRERLIDLILRPDFYRECALQARKRVLEMCSAETVRKRFGNLIHEVARTREREVTEVVSEFVVGPFTRLQRHLLCEAKVVSQLFVDRRSKRGVVVGAYPRRDLLRFVAGQWQLIELGVPVVARSTWGRVLSYQKSRCPDLCLYASPESAVASLETYPWQTGAPIMIGIQQLEAEEQGVEVLEVLWNTLNAQGYLVFASLCHPVVQSARKHRDYAGLVLVRSSRDFPRGASSIWSVSKEACGSEAVTLHWIRKTWSRALIVQDGGEGIGEESIGEVDLMIGSLRAWSRAAIQAVLGLNLRFQARQFCVRSMAWWRKLFSVPERGRLVVWKK